MATDTFRVGITRDNLRADGTPIFDERAFDLLKDPRFEWEFLADDVKELTAAHAQRYDALCVLLLLVAGHKPAVPAQAVIETAAVVVAPAKKRVRKARNPRIKSGGKRKPALSPNWRTANDNANVHHLVK